MKSIIFDSPGDESVLKLGDIEPPRLGPCDIRLRVMAAGVNRADLLQRQGLYPPPPGASSVLGLECAGTVIEIGSEVDLWEMGDRAMALVSGGGYAQEIVVDAECAMPIPYSFSWEEGAAFPEVYLTVFLNVFQLAGFMSTEICLVHGGGSGIGTASIQLVKSVGATIIVTAGSDEKCSRCLELGADFAINYREENFLEVIQEVTQNKGVDVILDSIGAPYLADNLSALAIDGRLVLIGLMGGARTDVDLGSILRKRISVIGSTLRARPVSEKRALIRNFLDHFGEAAENGGLRPVIDSVLPMDKVADAHRAMQASTHFGKIVLSL